MGSYLAAELFPGLEPIVEAVEVSRGMLVEVQFKNRLAAGYLAEDFNPKEDFLSLSQSSEYHHPASLPRKDLIGYRRLYPGEEKEVFCDEGQAFVPKPGELIEAVREEESRLLERVVGFVNPGYGKKVVLSLFSLGNSNGSDEVPLVHTCWAIREILAYKTFGRK